MATPAGRKDLVAPNVGLPAMVVSSSTTLQRRKKGDLLT